MKYTNLNKKQKTTSAWKRALMMFCAVVIVAVISVLAYDGFGWNEEYELYTYEDSYIGDTPYWDDYQDYSVVNYAEGYTHEHSYYYHGYDNYHTYSDYYLSEYYDSEYYDYYVYSYPEYEGDYSGYQGYINDAPQMEIPDYEPERIHDFLFLDADDYMYLISRLDLYLAD